MHGRRGSYCICQVDSARQYRYRWTVVLILTHMHMDSGGWTSARRMRCMRLHYADSLLIASYIVQTVQLEALIDINFNILKGIVYLGGF